MKSEEFPKEMNQCIHNMLYSVLTNGQRWQMIPIGEDFVAIIKIYRRSLWLVDYIFTPSSQQ